MDDQKSFEFTHCSDVEYHNHHRSIPNTDNFSKSPHDYGELAENFLKEIWQNTSTTKAASNLLIAIIIISNLNKF